MYLALLLSPESEAELRRHAPNAPTDLHLTIIHSKNELVVGLPLPSVALPIIGQGVSTDSFGPPTKRVKITVEGRNALESLPADRKVRL